jgi:hypothetical protein
MSEDEIKENLTRLLTDLVYAQDHGLEVARILESVMGLSATYAMSVAIHTHRLKMIHVGARVKVPQKEGDFVIGFAPVNDP